MKKREESELLVIVKAKDLSGTIMASYLGHLSHGDTYYLRKNILEHLVLSKQTE